MATPSGVITPASTLQSVPQIHRQEAHSVERTIGEFVAAWNRHDPASMAELWADDGDLINPEGKLARGREEVRALFAEEQKGIMGNTTCEMTLKSVRWASDNVVIVDADCSIKGLRDSGGRELQISQPHVVLLLHKLEGDRWNVLAARPYLYATLPGGGK